MRSQNNWKGVNDYERNFLTREILNIFVHYLRNKKNLRLKTNERNEAKKNTKMFLKGNLSE